MPNIGQQHSTEKSRQLQRNLYLAAQKDKQRRFHALYDRIFRLDFVKISWHIFLKDFVPYAASFREA